MSAFYRSLGPVQSMQLVEEKSEEQRTRRYRVAFQGSDWIQTCGLTAEGEIAGWEMEPAW
jgi:hypothetical protein